MMYLFSNKIFLKHGNNLSAWHVETYSKQSFSVPVHEESVKLKEQREFKKRWLGKAAL
jgi:hypothetical protein